MKNLQKKTLMEVLAVCLVFGLVSGCGNDEVIQGDGHQVMDEKAVIQGKGAAKEFSVSTNVGGWCKKYEVYEGGMKYIMYSSGDSYPRFVMVNVTLDSLQSVYLMQNIERF